MRQREKRQKGDEPLAPCSSSSLCDQLPQFPFSGAIYPQHVIRRDDCETSFVLITTSVCGKRKEKNISTWVIISRHSPCHFFFVKLCLPLAHEPHRLFFFKAPEFEMCPCVWEGHHIISMVVDCLVGGREWEPTVLPRCRTHKISVSLYYSIPNWIGAAAAAPPAKAKTGKGVLP